MNKQNINKKPLRGFLSVCAIAALAGALLITTARVASADYGQGAVYQIALATEDPPGGGGIWLWIALYQDGTGDYAGSDCAGGLNRFFRGLRAVPDAGDATWHYVTSYTDPCTGITYSPAIEIDDVVLRGLPSENGGQCGPPPFNATITVPATYGHYTSTGHGFNTMPQSCGILQCPGPGSFTQLEVAP